MFNVFDVQLIFLNLLLMYGKKIANEMENKNDVAQNLYRSLL
jgi:hypothetical protein